MRENLRAYRAMLALGFQAAPREASLQILSGIFFELLGPAAAYGAKLLVDAAIAKDLTLALAAAAGLSLAMGLELVAVYYYLDWLFMVFDRTEALATRKLMKLIGGAQGLEHHERPDYLDQVQRIREDQNRLSTMVNATSGMLRVLVVLTATAILLARLHSLLLLMPLLGLLSFWLGKKSRDLEIAAYEATSEAARLQRHLFEVATASSQGKELRMSALNKVLLEKHHRVSNQILRRREAAAWKGALFRSGEGLVSGLTFAGAIALVLWLAIGRQATPGDVILTVGLAARMDGVIFTLVEYGNSLFWALRVGKRLLWLEETARSAPAEAAAPAAPPERLSEGIEIRDLSFRYAGSERYILKDLSLRLPAGKVIALVGENGAGKTTLIKLLCGFYRPEGGQILVDGADLTQMRPEDWRARLSAAFQDFSKFEFLARETVGIAEREKMEDQAAVSGALERAGAGSLIAALPAGLETQLGTAWENGVDLSGGQWQKLALGRGLMRQEPLLVVFDEPTAALDAPTEHALFERFAQAARTGGSRGTVTLLVSHRFSTVRMADLILVMEGGAIREQGSHAELTAQRGLYAELYELQSRAYR